ncbi:hypothetical protein F5B19DRAFT_445479 [Rostrohypoxylon terebratum]|nr:hypothetical protein F5B19DRAFT_445479 [Rostrohypoxylon terebratum]
MGKMAPGQNKFSIIPNAPGAINGDSDTSESRQSKRPMTTKQAKKAYQKANTGPKLSKAEKRRQELFEQDRIRKEFEKEKNQARAKAARDRKREKEEKERAEKKKKGLPLVDVHPSQDTIAWFVRGKAKGNGRKKQDSQDSPVSAVVSLSTTTTTATTTASVSTSKDYGDDLNGRNDRNHRNHDNDRASSSDENQDEPPPKRQRTESPAPASASARAPIILNANLVVDVNADLDRGPNSAGVIDDSTPAAQVAQPVQGLDIGELPPSPKTDDLNERYITTDHFNIDIDEPETIESLPDELFSELIDATISSFKDEKDEATVPKAQLKRSPSRDRKRPNSQPPPNPSKDCVQSSIPTKDLPLEQKTEGSASLSSIQPSLQTLSTTNLNSRTSSTPKGSAPDLSKSIFPTNAPLMNPPAPSPRKAQPSVSLSRSFQHPQTPMGPPPIPPKFKSRSHVPSRDSGTPPFSAKQFHTHKYQTVPEPQTKSHVGYARQIMREELLPTSTQLFMLSHLDDFFPSPSQEVREIFDEPKSGIGISSDTSKARLTRSSLTSPDKDMPSRSTPSFSSISRPAPTAHTSDPKPTPIQKNAFSTYETNQPLVPPTYAQSSGNSEAFDVPFFSTQDFILSSQDMKDLEDEAISPVGLKQKGRSHQPNITINSPNPCLSNIARSDMKAYSATVMSDNYQPTFSCLPGAAVGCPEKSSRVRKNATLSNHQTGNGVKPVEKTGHKMPPTASQTRQEEIPNVSHVKKEAAQLRGSPKPFFALSGREAHYKYVIERSKTTSWEGISTRQKAQEELQLFQKSEDERSNKLLSECIIGGKDCHAISNGMSQSDSGPKGSIPKQKNQTKSQSQPRSINQLSGPAERTTQNQKAEEPTERRPRQNNSRSSYEEMLEMLKRKETQRQGQQAMPASQETDYGDAGLDDILCEML